MSKRARGILIAVAVLVAVPLATSTVHAQPPFPSDYRGTVFVAGEPAGAGLEVTAQILDWTTDEAAPTDGSGEYWLGIAPTEGHYAGETIYFYVDGTLADETALFVAGESVDNFDLHVAAIAPPSPTPTATATPVPTETPGATPTVTPTPGATPTTTPTPTTSVTPTAMPTPSAAPTATPTPTPTAASPDTTDGFGIGMIIGIAAGALALGGLIMWLIMRRGRGQPPQPPSPGSRGQRPPRSGGERPAQREPG